MPYVTSMERITEAKGEAKGAANVVLKQLAKVCGPLPEELEGRIRDLRLQGLEALAEAVLGFQSLKDLEAWLGSRGAGRSA
jgi:hypothetical protein